jgi:hypothetical protein
MKQTVLQKCQSFPPQLLQRGFKLGMVLWNFQHPKANGGFFEMGCTRPLHQAPFIKTFKVQSLQLIDQQGSIQKSTIEKIKDC